MRCKVDVVNTSPAPGQPVEVMHGSNAPLLGRIIQTQMERIKSGQPVTETISLEDAVPGETDSVSPLTVFPSRE